MENRHPPADSSSATYEIRLQGTLPKALQMRLPPATICSTRAETVLFRHIENAAELDSLLDQLMSMGLVLTEIHEVPLADAPASTTRVRGQGTAQESEASGDDQGV